MKKNHTQWGRATVLTLVAASSIGWLGAPQVHAGLFNVSPDKERSMGDDAAKQIGAGSKTVTGPVADWVKDIGARLASVSSPEFKYTFTVIDSPEINAFALPGGHVFVYTGIRKVAQSDDQLAAVLAHEITHAEEHHYAKQYSKSSKRGLLLGVLTAVVGVPYAASQVIGIADFAATARYSRVLESEADKKGLLRMARAGFDPHGMEQLLSNLEKEDRDSNGLNKWFTDHPATEKRLEDVKTLMPQAVAAEAKPSTAASTVVSDTPTQVVAAQ